MSTTPPAPERVSADSLSELDETGEETTHDKASTKKLYVALASIVGLIVVALVVITLFVFPGFLKDKEPEQTPAQQETNITEQSDQSGKFRIGDTLRVVSGGKLVNITITEFTPTGALAEDGSGTEYAVSQNQLDRYARENPTKFTDRLPDSDSGKITPRLDPTTTNEG